MSESEKIPIESFNWLKGLDTYTHPAPIITEEIMSLLQSTPATQLVSIDDFKAQMDEIQLGTATTPIEQLHWHINDLVYLAREMEKIVSPIGYHIGIAGGVLHKGESNKDADIILYPHCTAVQPISKVLVALSNWGFSEFSYRTGYHADLNGDFKHIYRSKFKGKIVDLFFLS